MPTFYIEQFGCRATQADGVALEVQLLQRGYTPAAKAAADFVVVNTCTVTSAADAQAREAIRKISAQNPAARVAFRADTNRPTGIATRLFVFRNASVLA